MQGYSHAPPIPARNVVGHSDIAPMRKEDPGELFDWKMMSEQGVGIYPAMLRAIGAADAVQLADYGYDITNIAKAILAFQRHFYPKRLTGVWDRECALLLQSLLDSVH